MEQKPTEGTTDYPNIASASITTATWTALKGSYTLSQDMDTLTLYVESSNATEVILIDKMEITMTAQPPEDQSGIQSGFEDNTQQGWAPRMGSETLTVALDAAKIGVYSLLTTTSGGTYYGPKLNVLGKRLAHQRT